jgi:hypothetical protein
LWNGSARSSREPSLYAKKVAEPPVSLPQLVAAARGAPGTYPGTSSTAWKNAAFKHCKGPDKDGFGWVVGVGIDNSDIYATVRQSSRGSVGRDRDRAQHRGLFTIVARRATRRSTRAADADAGGRGAAIDAHVWWHRDETIGAFNDMTVNLREPREADQGREGRGVARMRGRSRTRSGIR